MNPASIWHRFGIDLASIWDRFKDHQGPSRTLPAPSGNPKNIKNKNNKKPFHRLGFEALDQLDQLVTSPKVENIFKTKKKQKPLPSRGRPGAAAPGDLIGIAPNYVLVSLSKRAYGPKELCFIHFLKSPQNCFKSI